MNALEYLDYLAARRATAPQDSLRANLYVLAGVEVTDDAMRRGLQAWAIERWTGAPRYRQRATTIVFGRHASDARRRAAGAASALGEEAAGDVTHIRRITSGWDETMVWPAFPAGPDR